MRTNRLAAALLLAAAAASPAFSATLHALIFANTEDEGIGCIYDVVNAGAFLRDVQKETGLTLKARVRLTVSSAPAEKLAAIRGWATVVDGWSKADLDKELKALEFGPDDVFFFYYSGHGGRLSGKADRWPDMALGDELTDLKYPADAVSKKKVQPRLTLVLGDCCNNFVDRSIAPKTKSAKVTAGLRPLFMDVRGVIISSSSEPGQYSLGGDDGGVFSNAYFKAAYNPANGDWASVLDAAQAATARASGGKQKAQFELKGLRPAGAGPAVAAAAAAAAQAPDEGDEDEAVVDGEGEAVGFLTIEGGRVAEERRPGASSYPFAELLSASLDARGDDLVVRLKLKSIPAKLVFNEKDLPADELEYDWSAYLDVDGDGAEDFALSLSHYKEKGSRRMEASLLDGCDPALFALTDEGGELVEAEVSASIEKNSIVLTLSGYQEYFELEEGAGVAFSAAYYKGGESYIP